MKVGLDALRLNRHLSLIEGNAVASMKSVSIGVILSLITLSVSAANPDNAAWLIFDKKNNDYFLLRVEMDTSKVGHATIAGGNEYAGRRYTGQSTRFGINFLGGGFTVTKNGAKPYMFAILNSTGDEINGEFLDNDGNSDGEFVGTLKGFTTVEVDLFQLCKKKGYNDYQCVNRGKDERCELGAHSKSSTFFSLENCSDALATTELNVSAAPAPKPSEPESKQARQAPETTDGVSSSHIDRFEQTNYTELFGISFLQQIEEIEGWTCVQSARSLFIKTYQCKDDRDPALDFLGFTPIAVTLWTNTHGVCAISGIAYIPEEAIDIYEVQTRISTPIFFSIGAPLLPKVRALNPKNSDYPVFEGARLDEIGLERGGRIFRWENLGPEKSVLQFEVYEVFPEYRILSEGKQNNAALTSAGIPADSKVNVAMMSLFAGWWEDCGIQ